MAVRKADVERWHKEIASAGGMLAGALAKGKRSPTLIDEVFEKLSDVVQDIKDRKDD